MFADKDAIRKKLLIALEKIDRMEKRSAPKIKIKYS